MDKKVQKMYCHSCKCSTWVRVEKKVKSCCFCGKPLSSTSCFDGSKFRSNS
jgi:hypothetical protein